MQYGTHRAPPDLGLSEGDEVSIADKKLLKVKDNDDSVDLSELDKNTSMYSGSKRKEGEYELVPGDSMDFIGEGFGRMKTGKEALLDMFL
jgi:hypothetical protein